MAIRGGSSFIACYLIREEVDEFVFIDIDEHHEDTYRFLNQCEAALGRPITYLRHEKYRSVTDVIRDKRIINTPYGAPCTLNLKKRVREKWERDHEGGMVFRHVWGYDAKEIKRIERAEKTMPEYLHVFPLRDHGLNKEQVHGMLDSLGIKRPLMYEFGYSNNNCVGCVKGGMGYWNKIRQDFPERFDEMAKLEREIGGSCINGVYLDELEPHRGRMEKAILPDCGMICQTTIDE